MAESNHVGQVRDAAHLLGIVSQADDAAVIEALVRLLSHSDEIVRQRAAYSLGPLDLASNSPDVVQALCSLMKEVLSRVYACF